MLPADVHHCDFVFSNSLNTWRLFVFLYFGDKGSNMDLTALEVELNMGCSMECGDGKWLEGNEGFKYITNMI